MFWARWRCFELGESWHHFFPGIFYIFLKCSLFVTDFFFASTGETFFVNPASGTMDITCPKDFPNRSLHTDLNSLYITALHFHFFSCWFEDFFYQKALWLNFILLWMDPFCSLHNLCSFWRGYSLPVSLRDSTCILRGAEFFLPWAVFCQLSTEYALRNCCFFSGGDHCEIWLSMALCFLRKRPINEDMFYDCASFFTCKYLATFKTLMERNTYFCSRVNGDILRSVSYRAGFSLPVASFCTLLLIHCRSLEFFF